jgi:hypothetical protein
MTPNRIFILQIPTSTQNKFSENYRWLRHTPIRRFATQLKPFLNSVLDAGEWPQ